MELPSITSRKKDFNSSSKNWLNIDAIIDKHIVRTGNGDEVTKHFQVTAENASSVDLFTG